MKEPVKIRTVQFVNLFEMCSNKDVEEWIRETINDIYTWGDTSYTLISASELHNILVGELDNPAELELALDLKDIEYLRSFIKQLEELPVNWIDLEG